MAVQQYESVDDINRAFSRRLRDAETDEEKREIGLEQREAVATFREQQAQIAGLEAHKATVLAKEGLSEWADLVTGNTPDEIDATAAKVKERVAMLTSNGQPSAGELYGSTGAGGGTPPAPKESSRRTKQRAFEEQYNDPTAMLNPRDINNYVQQRLGEHVLRSWQDQGLKRWRDYDLNKLEEE